MPFYIYNVLFCGSLLWPAFQLVFFRSTIRLPRLHPFRASLIFPVKTMKQLAQQVS